MSRQLRTIDSLRIEYNRLKNMPNEYKWKYEANREIYFRREKSADEERRYDVLQKSLLVGLVIFLFFQLK